MIVPAVKDVIDRFHENNYGKIKKDSNFQNDIVSSFFRAAL